MNVRHEIALPQDEPFYTDQRDFEVNVDTTACGNFTLNGVPFNLGPPTPVLAPLLQAAALAGHEASLEQLTEAAMRFYRGGGVRTFSPAEYVSMLFMMRYGFGHAFRRSALNSVEHIPRGAGATLHSEALAGFTELFAYGLACHFTAQLVGVPIDRFFFLTAAGARADFQARVTPADLEAAGAGIGVLAPNGFILELEVKARTGWASFRSTSDQGKALLKNVADKIAARPTHAFLSIIVGLTSRPGGPQSIGRIVIADPGEGDVLAEREQTIVLLEETLTLLYRHGLWITLRHALDWLEALRPLNHPEAELRGFVGPLDAARQQYRIVEVERGTRVFNGRIFSDVALRVGRIGQRGMAQEEAEERLRLDELGRLWYSGVDVAFERLISARDAERLRTYGVRQLDEVDLSGRSAYHMEEWPMGEERESVRNILRVELRRW